MSSRDIIRQVGTVTVKAATIHLIIVVVVPDMVIVTIFIANVIVIVARCPMSFVTVHFTLFVINVILIL